MTVQAPRVAHFARNFSRLSETFLYERVSELRRRGSETHVVTLVRENEAERPFDHVHTVRLPAAAQLHRAARRLLVPLGRADARAYAMPVYRPHLRRVLERIAPDVVNAHFGAGGVLVAPVARELGIPLVVSFYGHDASGLPRIPEWRRHYDRLWESASAITALSETMRGVLAELGCPDEKIRVVRMAMPVAASPDAYHERSGPVRRLVSVGRMEEKKGHLDTIRAVERVHAAGHPVSLMLVGEGQLREGLERYVREHGLEGVVTFRGALPNPEVLAAMRQADAFILCSRTASDGDQEGMPTVLVEAQAAGLPCISTRHAGIPEMFPTENHWLLAGEGDVEGIAERITRLMAASEEQVRGVCRAGRRKVAADFDPGTEAEKLLELFRELARRPARRAAG